MSTIRLRKVHCSECGYVVRMSRTWIAVGLPNCPNPACLAFGAPLECADPADAVECGLLSLDDLPRPIRTQICKANGWEDAIVRTNRAQEPGFGAGRKRRRPVAEMPF